MLRYVFIVSLLLAGLLMYGIAVNEPASTGPATICGSIIVLSAAALLYRVSRS